MKLTSPSAQEYEAQGNVFDPQLHFVENERDSRTFRWLTELVEKYDPFIVAHSLGTDPSSGTVSVELQFGTDARLEMLKCRKEYQKGPPKRPKVGFDQGRLHQRLRNGRFYLLPDKRPFLLLGIWDSHGNRWGKVQTGTPRQDGSVPVMNEFVPEEVLRRCPLIPRDEEPFGLKR